MDIKRRRNTYW